MLGWSKLYSVTVGQFGPQMHVGHIRRLAEFCQKEQKTRHQRFRRKTPASEALVPCFLLFLAFSSMSAK